MKPRSPSWLLPQVALVSLLAACGRPESKAPGTYQTEPVGKRDIVVSVEAAGLIEPSVTVELKSKASGQILKIHGETGDVVEAGTPLVQIDKRNPQNSLSQATAQLEAARARRSIAEAQKKRAEKLLAERIINDVDFEQAQLEWANAKAEVVRSQVAVETARIQLDDTDLRAPITGTIIEKLVEEGQVISSPIMDVGGGTVMLKMADLTSVQVRTLVDETDIGKISPGQPALVTVTAFPNQPFRGEVQKIEPQAVADQTVTTFAVRIVLKNDKGLL
ncbi:MAG: efflux RND transporter periplasmic adaptor subunit, partial [Gammaproteobacteria bacterium]|nr:efflux RND transporter periplasmic adaptor subunit [Gammaproteobacteria bacterium]